MQLKPARLINETLLAEVDQYKTDTENFHLWWLGQSGYLISWAGEKIIIDPYLSDSLTKKYANTAKQHIRISERVVDPALLTGISLVSSSHNHTDHLDGETLIPLLANNPGIAFVIPEANRAFVAERARVKPETLTGLNDGTQFTKGAFTFYGVPAAHNELERDENGHCRYMGYVIKFGRWTIYHSGDTLWFKGMEDILRPYNIDLALLPINGNDITRGVAGNLDCREAATLGKSIGAKMVIPCHYDMFTFNTANPDDFVLEAERINQPCKVLEQGGHFSSAELG